MCELTEAPGAGVELDVHNKTKNLPKTKLRFTNILKKNSTKLKYYALPPSKTTTTMHCFRLFTQ